MVFDHGTFCCSILVKFAFLNFQTKAILRKCFLTSQSNIFYCFVHYSETQYLLSRVSCFYSLIHFGLEFLFTSSFLIPFLHSFDLFLNSVSCSRSLQVPQYFLGKLFSHLVLGHLPAGFLQKTTGMIILYARGSRKMTSQSATYCKALRLLWPKPRKLLALMGLSFCCQFLPQGETNLES